MTDFIFIRHARSIQNKEVGPSHWTISEEGIKLILKLAEVPEIRNIDILYSSTELKAQLTANNLVKALHKKDFSLVQLDKRLNEVDRDNGTLYSTEEEFKLAVKKSFLEKNKLNDNWEPVANALTRFNDFMNELQKRGGLHDKTVGIVSHGTIMSLYFAKVGNYYDNAELLYKKWSQTTFCSWGKIVDGKIARDLS